MNPTHTHLLIKHRVTLKVDAIALGLFSSSAVRAFVWCALPAVTSGAKKVTSDTPLEKLEFSFRGWGGGDYDQTETRPLLPSMIQPRVNSLQRAWSNKWRKAVTQGYGVVSCGTTKPRTLHVCVGFRRRSRLDYTP